MGTTSHMVGLDSCEQFKPTKSRKGPRSTKTIDRKRHALPPLHVRNVIVSLDDRIEDEHLPLDESGEPMERSRVIRREMERRGFVVSESQIDRTLRVERRAYRGLAIFLRDGARALVAEYEPTLRGMRAEVDVA
jgi:hypothetical protein